MELRHCNYPICYSAFQPIWFYIRCTSEHKVRDLRLAIPMNINKLVKLFILRITVIKKSLDNDDKLISSGKYLDELLIDLILFIISNFVNFLSLI